MATWDLPALQDGDGWMLLPSPFVLREVTLRTLETSGKELWN
jgi:hypothetical protein